MPRLLEPCPNCGRPVTETTGYPETRGVECWWCEHRAADDMANPVRVQFDNPTTRRKIRGRDFEDNVPWLKLFGDEEVLAGG